MIRTIAERLSRKVVLRRRLSQEFGGLELFVTPGAALSYWRPNVVDVDPMLMEFARRFVSSGASVWDVGANSGLFTFAAAARAGREGQVVGLEADDWMVSLLRRSQSRLPRSVAKVIILGTAISADVGLAEFAIAKRGRAANFLKTAGGSSQHGGIRESQWVTTVSLDWLLGHFRPPDVLKVDVEGAEDAVLEGSVRVLEESRPVVLCEVVEKNQPAVARIFAGANYDLRDAASPGFSNKVDTPTSNVVAIPREKI